MGWRGGFAFYQLIGAEGEWWPEPEREPEDDAAAAADFGIAAV